LLTLHDNANIVLSSYDDDYADADVLCNAALLPPTSPPVVAVHQQQSPGVVMVQRQPPHQQLQQLPPRHAHLSLVRYFLCSVKNDNY